MLQAPYQRNPELSAVICTYDRYELISLIC